MNPAHPVKHVPFLEFIRFEGNLSTPINSRTLLASSDWLEKYAAYFKDYSSREWGKLRKTCVRTQSVSRWRSTKLEAVLTDCERVEDGSNDSEEKNGAQVVEEQSVRHEVSGIKYNWREHIEEKRIGCERRDVHAPSHNEQGANNKADNNQQARFGEDFGQCRRHVETWNNKNSNWFMAVSTYWLTAIWEVVLDFRWEQVSRSEFNPL